MRALTVVLAVFAGLALAWVDARPGWDDTGLLVGALLLAAGGFGFLAPRRPWVQALAVGVWIPLAGIVRTHNYGSLMALAVAFVGAYGGSAARRLAFPPRA